MKKQIKVVWLAPYPLHTLKNELSWGRYKGVGHPCSWIVNLAKALGARSDVELHILTLSPGVKRSQCIQHPDGYALHVIKSGIPFVNRGYPSFVPLNAVIGYKAERLKIVKKIRRLKPDVVHAHGTEYAYGLAAMDAEFPWLVSIQGIIEDYLRTNPCLLYRLVAPLENRVLKSARYIGGRTHFDKGYAQKTNPDATVLDLPEAMHEVFFFEPWKDPSNHRIVFVGSYERRKGLHRLIESLGLISAEYPDMILEAVGGGSPEQRAALKEQARTRGVKLNLLGFKSAQEIAHLHRECCCFVIPSENENSPNTLAEAMASALPCVAYDTGGISSMMETGKSGLLVPFGDTEGLANAISRLFQSPELRIKLSSNAQKNAERNRPEHVAEVTFTAYRQVLDGWGE